MFRCPIGCADALAGLSPSSWFLRADSGAGGGHPLIEMRKPDYDQRASSIAANNVEAMELVSGHQDEAAGCGRPADFAAEAMTLAFGEVEQLVLAIVAMLWY